MYECNESGDILENGDDKIEALQKRVDDRIRSMLESQRDYT